MIDRFLVGVTHRKSPRRISDGCSEGQDAVERGGQVPPLASYPSPQRNRIRAEQEELEERLRQPEALRISRA